MIMDLFQFFMLLIPTAAIVPMTVAMMEETSATIRVLIKDWIIRSLWNSFTYQSSVKPVKLERLLD